MRVRGNVAARAGGTPAENGDACRLWTAAFHAWRSSYFVVSAPVSVRVAGVPSLRALAALQRSSLATPPLAARRLSAAILRTLWFCRVLTYAE